MLIEITNWATKKVIFSYDCVDNTIKKTVEEAVKRGINLSNADLRRANLNNADLRSANLQNANLSHADIIHADLREANLSFANFVDADLSDANLSNANLSDASFFWADLSDADLSNANLRLASLSDANLNGAKINYPMNIPDGEFIAWKKIYRKRHDDYVIVKLKILADSKRSCATTDKCRCDKALVLGFETLKGSQLKRTKQVTNYKYEKCTYKVGEIVYADEWDYNRWNECSHGIHFFLDRRRAVEYFM